jgi:uncharacterized protein with von Willebrand factor type A (vWA) domain
MHCDLSLQASNRCGHRLLRDGTSGVPHKYQGEYIMSATSPLEETVEFAENPEPRCPCVLLLDTSSSMRGAPIAALNEGLRAFREDLMQDALALRRVEVALITFDSQVQLV